MQIEWKITMTSAIFTKCAYTLGTDLSHPWAQELVRVRSPLQELTDLSFFAQGMHGHGY